MMASLALVLSVLALGSVSPTLRSTDGHALSSAIFWAAIKALAYCQSPGSNDSKVSIRGYAAVLLQALFKSLTFSFADHVGESHPDAIRRLDQKHADAMVHEE
jgi:hypothetical protein